MPYVQSPPDFQQLLTDLAAEDATSVLTGSVDDPEYLHWDRLRHLTPPDGLTHEKWWLRLKLARTADFRWLPLDGPGIGRSGFTVPDRVLELLHFADQHLAGEIGTDEVVTADDEARRRYLVNSLIEEAIRSSQLEGATTSRRVAKELLQSGREPANRSERMILNNHRAMQFMREGLGDRLTPENVLELHRIVTDGTLDDPDAAGRLQRPGDDRVAVFDREGARLIQQPPPAELLPERLVAMCAFANAEADERFIHPVIRAIVLHFWVGFDHPFEDGNGRLARALFYWSMRTQGYWLVEYLSISRIFRQAPAQYTRSFQYVETDGGDTTYFLLYQLETIQRATGELHRYLRSKAAEVRKVESLLKTDTGFNQRQLALLGYAMRHPNTTFTFGVHAASHGVTHETARSDLLTLETRGLLRRHRAGRQYRFTTPPDLAERLGNES